ncbi:hypothetical protein CEXT_17751 [Caerostris extrusa]|uniref:Secreted protein n=1 Tax=Caerostris extrusa TaxID=172846 RepID=A0AAV4W0K1_CAEEX|nr:hypothetical protein CEXT_17751 [Caerostris extrusa]
MIMLFTQKTRRAGLTRWILSSGVLVVEYSMKRLCSLNYYFAVAYEVGHSNRTPACNRITSKLIFNWSTSQGISRLLKIKT